MLNTKNQTTTLSLILIGFGLFLLALAGCSDQNFTSPTKDIDLKDDDTTLLAPYIQAENQLPASDGMMGGGMMMGMGGMMGGGMMWNGVPGWNLVEEDATPLTIAEAVEAAKEYLEAIGNPDLALAEVMEFTNHFYAEVYEKSTGIGALEILIDLYTGIVHPEPGPNMMWNTKYGHKFGRGGMGMMGGMGWTRGRFNGKKPTAEMPVTAEKALEIAQKFLNARLPRTKVAEEADHFYGYYTIHVLKDGEIYGMLSVNGYTGQVWYHGWHGDFVGIKELEE